MITDEIGRVVTAISDFTRERDIAPKFYFHTVEQLKGESDNPDAYWARFEEQAGVYCFFSKAEILYIGMSSYDTGDRLDKWLFKDNDKSAALESDHVVLSVVLKDEEAYMAPALEWYLIGEFAPILNRRKAKT